MIVVIGASSFIGIYTVEELLRRGMKVVATGRSDRFRQHYERLGVQYVNLDLTNREDFLKLPTTDVEGVILLAGLLPANVRVNLDEDENAADYFLVNTIGTINVLEYCRVNGIRRVISTTSYADVFNSWSADHAITEDEPRGFQCSGDHAAYVISKNAAGDVLEYYNQQHHMKNACFRLPPVYGVGPHGSLFVNGTYVKSGLQVFIEKAMTGEDITIFGDGKLSRDVVYVKDVARAFCQAVVSEAASGLYNITAGSGVSLRRQAEVVAKLFAPSPDRMSKIVCKPEMKNNTPSFLFSIEKAGRDFGYQPLYADFELMMTDYRNDLLQRKFQPLFRY